MRKLFNTMLITFCFLIFVKSSQKTNEMSIHQKINLLQQQKHFQNSIIVNEDQKTEIILRQGQQKYLKMNIKNVFSHSTFTQYVYTQEGLVTMYANVCNQKNIRLPSMSKYDFNFGLLETQLKSLTIRKKAQQVGINLKDNIYLCVLAHGLKTSLIEIEYTFTKQIIMLLRTNENKTAKTNKGLASYYQLQGSLQRSIRVKKITGQPFIEVKTCSGRDLSFQACFENLKRQQTNSKRFEIYQDQKFYQFKPCEKCIVYVKVSSQVPSEVLITLLSVQNQTQVQAYSQYNFFFNIFIIVLIILGLLYYFYIKKQNDQKYSFSNKIEFDEQNTNRQVYQNDD